MSNKSAPVYTNDEIPEMVAPAIKDANFIQFRPASVIDINDNGFKVSFVLNDDSEDHISNRQIAKLAEQFFKAHSVNINDKQRAFADADVEIQVLPDGQRTLEVITKMPERAKSDGLEDDYEQAMRALVADFAGRKLKRDIGWVKDLSFDRALSEKMVKESGGRY